MKVSTAQPFQIIYSLYQHEYLGYLFESFAVQLDDQGRLTFTHQNISNKNAAEFASMMDAKDFELIKLMDSMQQDAVIKFFCSKKINCSDFFLRTFSKDKGNKLLQDEIDRYMERRRSKILELIPGKRIFEMGSDGEPTWKEIILQEEKASVLFHFRRNETNTHYFPTIKYNGEKVEFQGKGAYIICNEPAWMVLKNKLFSFNKDVDGKKLLPFLNKRYIEVPRAMEETYYKKFVAPLIASFDVYAVGFDIKTEHYVPVPVLTISEVPAATAMSLFGDEAPDEDANDELAIDLAFKYGSFRFKADQPGPVSVSMEATHDSYVFHRIKRDLTIEKNTKSFLKELGLDMRGSRVTLPKSTGIVWFNQCRNRLEENKFVVLQNNINGKKYFLGDASISIEVNENIDWFDVNALIKFGEFEIPFNKLRKLVLSKDREFTLPNGEIAVIPESWLTDYSEIFAFLEKSHDENQLILKKHHLSLVNDLGNSSLAKVTMSQKLRNLQDFEKIDDHALPQSFNGLLRPYQKAGYNWMQFLNKFNFGGCLADDMGLGKTVQALAMLQYQKESGNSAATLLVMPTSLIFNWEMESKKFTPDLKIFIYTGTSREKTIGNFSQYDLIFTTYGIVRLDIEILQQYNFNYVILDESQAIKNPDSNIAKAVKKLQSKNRLILTGTPLENSTLDLWSQMTFINPGLLGNKHFFRNEFLNPIEKKHDESKTTKLYSIIKPFILRRHKSTVAKELPEKIENIHYCTMTAMQEERYEAEKNYFRSKILDQIETKGLNGSQIVLLQGLTRLRQLANHPLMVDPEYKGDSGKMEDIVTMLTNAISNQHKVLIFSQFVKHLTILSDYLKSNNICFSYLDGTTKNRQEQVEKFQNSDEINIFLISMKAGGTGLNLTKAEYVFLLDPWWNPAVEAQAVDRAHRIGQTNTVLSYKFISKNTVEEKILTLQQRKLKLANDLISTEESFVKNLSKDDIAALLD